MDYQRIYDRIISKAKNRLRSTNEYYERHHIIPRSMGGTNLADNLVLLTAKEHYIAHHLLWRIHKNPSMAHAFWMMSTTRVGNSRFKISAYGYHVAKKAATESMIKRMADPSVREAIRNGLMGHSVSEETRKKISDALKGRTADPDAVARRANANKGKRNGKTWEELFGHQVAQDMKEHFRSLYLGKKLTADHCTKISNGLKGRTLSDLTKNKISLANRGRRRSEESKAKMSKSKIGKSLDEATKEKISSSLTGRSKSEHTKARISESRKGMRFSDDHRLKLSQSHQGKLQSEETKRKRSESLKKYYASKILKT